MGIFNPTALSEPFIRQNQEAQEFSDVIAELDNVIVVYPYLITSGLTLMTDKGEQGWEFDIEAFKQIYITQDISKPVQCYWNNSLNMVVNDYVNETSKPAHEQFNVTFNAKIGTILKGYLQLSSATTLEPTAMDFNNVNLTTFMLSQSFTILFPIGGNESDWKWSANSIVKYLYLIVDPISLNKQYYYLTSLNPYYDTVTNKVFGYVAQFEQVNNLFNQNGKNIFNVVNSSNGINAPTPTPKENVDSNNLITSITLDNQTSFLIKTNNDYVLDYLNIGVDSYQLTINSPSQLCGTILYGTVIDNQVYNLNLDDNNNILSYSYKTTTPRLLLNYQSKVLNPNISTIKGQLNLNYTLSMYTIPIYENIYDSWKEYWKSIVSISTNREFQGGFKYLPDLKSNTSNLPITSINTKYDTVYINNMLDSSYNIIPRYIYNNDNAIILSYGSKYNPLDNLNSSIQYTDIDLPTFLNHNWLYNRLQTTIAFSYEDGFKMSIEDIPLIGGFLNNITLGLSPSWFINVGNSDISYLQGMTLLHGLIPQQTYKMINYGIMGDIKSGGLNVAPSETYSNNPNEFQAIGNVQYVCGYKCSLTDLYISSDNTTYNTSYLGQTTDYQGNTIPNHTFTKQVEPTFNKYIVYYINTKNIQKANINFTYYSNNLQVQETWLESNSKYKNDITLWMDEVNYFSLPQHSINNNMTKPWPIQMDKVLPNGQSDSTVINLNTPIPSTYIPPKYTSIDMTYSNTPRTIILDKVNTISPGNVNSNLTDPFKQVLEALPSKVIVNLNVSLSKKLYNQYEIRNNKFISSPSPYLNIWSQPYTLNNYDETLDIELKPNETVKTINITSKQVFNEVFITGCSLQYPNTTSFVGVTDINNTPRQYELTSCYLNFSTFPIVFKNVIYTLTINYEFQGTTLVINSINITNLTPINSNAKGNYISGTKLHQLLQSIPNQAVLIDNFVTGSGNETITVPMSSMFSSSVINALYTSQCFKDAYYCNITNLPQPNNSYATHSFSSGSYKLWFCSWAPLLVSNGYMTNTSINSNVPSTNTDIIINNLTINY